MTPSPHDPQKLERVVHQALHDLPPRPAPRSLEQRVLAEIARRAALPWWRRSFLHWPLVARAAFLVLCIGVAKFTFLGTVWAMAGFDPVQFREAFATQFAWMDAGFSVVRAITGFLEIMFRNIPTLWLYGGLAFLASMYAALFGLGAAAYRTLYAHR
jgi:hypothetical protein